MQSGKLNGAYASCCRKRSKEKRANGCARNANVEIEMLALSEVEMPEKLKGKKYFLPRK